MTNVSFHWAAQNSSNVNGGTPLPGTMGGNITDNLTANDINPETTYALTYNVIPTSSEGCDGDLYNVTINVNANPDVSFSGLAEAYCDNVSPATLVSIPPCLSLIHI